MLLEIPVKAIPAGIAHFASLSIIAEGNDIQFKINRFQGLL